MCLLFSKFLCYLPTSHKVRAQVLTTSYKTLPDLPLAHNLSAVISHCSPLTQSPPTPLAGTSLPRSLPLLFAAIEMLPFSRPSGLFSNITFSVKAPLATYSKISIISFILTFPISYLCFNFKSQHSLGPIILISIYILYICTNTIL